MCLASCTQHNVFKSDPYCWVYKFILIYYCYNIPLFHHSSSIVEHKRGFHLRTIMNKDAINILVLCFDGHIDSFLGIHSYIHWLSRHRLSFNSYCQIVVPSSQTDLHSHQQCIKASVVLHNIWNLVWLVFFILDILVGVHEYLTGVLICISLIRNDVKYFFMGLLAFCVWGRGGFLFWPLFSL